MKELVKGCIVIFENYPTELIEEVMDNGKIKYTLLNNSRVSWVSSNLENYYKGQECTVVYPFTHYYEEINSGV